MRQISFALIACSLFAGMLDGCNRRPTSDNPSVDVDVRAAPPVTEIQSGPVTLPASRPYISSGRAVAPQTSNGPTLIQDGGPGSPGTR